MSTVVVTVLMIPVSLVPEHESLYDSPLSIDEDDDAQPGGVMRVI